MNDINLQDALKRPIRTTKHTQPVKMWMAVNHKTGELDPKTFWTKEPSEIIHSLHEKGGWSIVPVEVRRLPMTRDERDAVVEECAAIADRYVTAPPEVTSGTMARTIRDMIRSLKGAKP